MTESVAHPPIVSREAWLVARKALLVKERELTRQRDAVSALRRRLPMVKLDKRYVFDGPAGETSLLDAFDGRRQLIVYHFMFGPDWEVGCPGCTGFVNALGDLSLLAKRDTSFTLISRAPLSKLAQYKVQRGWQVPWLSSQRSDFNYDFHVTHDEAIAPIEYNYRSKAELEAFGGPVHSGEAHALSVFFRLDDDVFHSYSAFARGVEGLTDSRALLDATPYGRQEDFEDSPSGWPQRPTYR
jgi:predicted dithiol-disulfide oxidoreductase (DUF899 family)